MDRDKLTLDLNPRTTRQASNKSLITPSIIPQTPFMSRLIDPSFDPNSLQQQITPNGLTKIIPELCSPLIPITVTASPTSNRLSEDINFENYQTKLKTNSMGSDNTNDEADMDRIERKRARNRLAASKCRKRKVDRIVELERQVADRDDEIQRLKKIIARYQSNVTSK